MTCFTSGHLYHMRFAIPAAPNPAWSMAPSDFSSSVQGLQIYIVAEARGRLTKSYPVNFLNWWHHLHPAGSVQAQEHFKVCALPQCLKLWDKHTPKTRAGDLDFARAQDRGHVSSDTAHLFLWSTTRAQGFTRCHYRALCSRTPRTLQQSAGTRNTATFSHWLSVWVRSHCG